MTTYAICNSAGFIQYTLSPNPITDKDQIAALAAQNLTVITIPDGKTGGTGMIVDGIYADFAVATPIPHPIIQYIAAQINSGAVSASAFHPTTLANMNLQLSTASMATVTAVATASTTTG